MAKDKDVKEVKFFKIGGTWDMVEKQDGLVGKGVLDDQALFALESELGYFNENADYSILEWELAQKMEELLINENKNTYDLNKMITFVPDINLLVKGTFTSLYSGDSSHLRTGLIIPIIKFLIEQSVKNPNIQILCAQGTDTADISLLPLLDVYTFDTNLPGFLFTGSNRSFRESSSDAPENFTNLFKITGSNLNSGAYWVFSSHLFFASDLIKISPLETRLIGEFSTFYSPHLKARRIDEVLKNNKNIIKKKYFVPTNHIANRISLKELYNAAQKVCIVDLGEQNELQEVIDKIKSPKYKAIVLAGHSFGNVSNPIRYACKEAVKNGKIIILTSRCVICNVSQRYSSGLIHINKELRSCGKKIISAYKLNKNIARALAIRVVHENLTQDQTKLFFDKYAQARSLSDFDVVMV